MKDKRTERICLCYHQNNQYQLKPEEQLTVTLAQHPDWKIIAMSAAGHHYSDNDTLYVVFERIVWNIQV